MQFKLLTQHQEREDKEKLQEAQRQKRKWEQNSNNDWHFSHFSNYATDDWVVYILSTGGSTHNDESVVKKNLMMLNKYWDMTPGCIHRRQNVWEWHKNRHRAQLVISLAARVCTKNSQPTSVLLLTAVVPVPAKNCSNCAHGLPSWMPVGDHPEQQDFCNFHWATGSPVMDHYHTKTNRGLWQIMPFRRHCRRTEVDMQETQAT